MLLDYQHSVSANLKEGKEKREVSLVDQKNNVQVKNPLHLKSDLDKTEKEPPNESGPELAKETSSKLITGRASSSSSEIGEESIARSKLRLLGYDFNECRELRQWDKSNKTCTEKPFEYVVKRGNIRFNQTNYETLSWVITDYVYELLESRGGLERLHLEGGSFVFVSPDWNLNWDKLLVLIHGAVVTAGQWLTRLFINDNLDVGSQLPYIKRAKKNGYAVVVLNTNNNKYENGAAIEGSETPIRHAVSAWKQVVMKCPAKHIAVVAHSFGGVVTCNLVKTFFQFFNEKVFAIMFADSIHQLEKD